MDLILWRHADAEDGVPDSARPLTTKGVAQADHVAAWLRKHVRHPKVLVSPAVRAQQTARALTESFHTESALDVGASVSAVLAAAGWPHADGTTIVVGHQPTLGQVAAWLLAGTDADWPVKKGAILWFSTAGDHAVLRAALTPDLAK